MDVMKLDAAESMICLEPWFCKPPCWRGRTVTLPYDALILPVGRCDRFPRVAAFGALAITQPAFVILSSFDVDFNLIWHRDSDG